MRDFIKKLLMDNKKDEGANGGNKPPPPPPPKSKAATEEKPPKDDKDSKGEGDSNTDEFGYTNTDKEPKDSKKESKKDESKDDKKVEDATGYEADEKPPEEKDSTGYSEDDDAEESSDDSKDTKEESKDELKLDLTGIADEDQKAIKEFVKTHKLSKEQAEALVNREKALYQLTEANAVKNKKEREKAALEQRASWKKELKEDPTFGGKNFAENVQKTNKVVEEFFPEMKKQLTKAGAMLPPYIMRDLVKLADHLYKTDHMIEGEPPSENDNKNEESEDPLDFYRTKSS